MAKPRLLAATTSVLLWLGIILVAGLSLSGTRPPSAIDASAPSNVFSAARAIGHLQQIAKQPHPIGSDEAVRVREYLIEQLRGLGGEVHVEQGTGSVHYGRNVHAGLVNNIVAAFAGQSNSRAIMLVAHYDSVPEGPGAGDDGAGLIVILEAIRAVRAGPPLKNDLIVLFTDGEEARGLLGAQAFAASHLDLNNRIGMMVNLEARGSSGPGLMFETSNDNGALIREFARAAPYPMATSLMAAIYKLLPNDTDFTPLKAAGLTGLNFAFLETVENYHTQLDTMDNLDQRSVQHLGTNVLGVIRHFGDLALPLPKEPDLVYFNWFASKLLVYGNWVAWIIALFVSIVFALSCVRSASRLELTLGRTVAGFGTFFLQLLLILGGSFAAYAIAKWIHSDFLDGDTFSNQLLFVGAMGIGFALATASQRLVRRIGLANLAAGQLFAVSLLTIVLCWFLMGGSYVLQWPLVFAMAGMLLSLRLTEPARSLCQFSCLIPALLILIPLAYMFFVALTFTYAALAPAAFLLTVLLAMGLPLLDRLAGPLKLSLPIIFLLSICLMAGGIHLSVRSATHPERDSLTYSLNADENKAKWVSYDAAPDTWTTRVLGPVPHKQADPAYAVGLDRPLFTNDATLVPLAPPSVTVTQDTTTNGERNLRLQLASTRGARTLVVRLPGDLKLAAAGWNEKIEPIADSSQANAPWTFRFYNAPPEGASLELRFPAQNHPIRVWVADTTPGLPAIAPLSPRPDHTNPGYGSDVTIVTSAREL